MKSLKRLLAREKLLGQRRPLVGQLLLLGAQNDVCPSKSFSRRASAALAPPSPPPMMTNVVELAMIAAPFYSCCGSTGHLLAYVVVERCPHQRGGQPGIGARGERTQLFRVGGQPQ